MTDKQRETECSKREHTLTLKDRARMEIGGVVEVSSFDEEAVVLVTVCGALTVEGTELRVGTLDLTRGVVSVDGSITAFYYEEEARSHRKGFFGGRSRKA